MVHYPNKKLPAGITDPYRRTNRRDPKRQRQLHIYAPQADLSYLKHHHIRAQDWLVLMLSNFCQGRWAAEEHRRLFSEMRHHLPWYPEEAMRAVAQDAAIFNGEVRIENRRCVPSWHCTPLGRREAAMGITRQLRLEPYDRRHSPAIQLGRLKTKRLRELVCDSTIHGRKIDKYRFPYVPSPADGERSIYTEGINSARESKTTARPDIPFETLADIAHFYSGPAIEKAKRHRDPDAGLSPIHAKPRRRLLGRHSETPMGRLHTSLPAHVREPLRDRVWTTAHDPLNRWLCWLWMWATSDSHLIPLVPAAKLNAYLTGGARTWLDSRENYLLHSSNPGHWPLVDPKDERFGPTPEEVDWLQAGK